MLSLLANTDKGPSLFSPAEWLGLPENYSAHGDAVGHMLDVVSWFMLALFVGWSIFFVICLIKFRKSKNPKASYHGVTNHVTTHLEIGVVIIEAVLLLGFAFPLWSDRADAGSYEVVKKQNPVRVRAIGYQFGWKFHYAGADNEFGFIDRTLHKTPGDTGLDPDDINGRDDFVTGTLKLPVNRPVILQITATDVIHNFSIIPMRIQQDAIPGKDVPMWFTPIKELKTSVVCGQLCGSGHGAMKGTLEVIPQKDFNEMVEKMSKSAAKKFDERQQKAKANFASTAAQS